MSSVDKIDPASWCGLGAGGLLDWNDDTWWGGLVAGGSRGCWVRERDAMLPWQNFLGSTHSVALPGCHHKPIKKAAHAGVICLNFLRNIFYLSASTDHCNNILFFLLIGIFPN